PPRNCSTSPALPRPANQNSLFLLRPPTPSWLRASLLLVLFLSVKQPLTNSPSSLAPVLTAPILPHATRTTSAGRQEGLPLVRRLQLRAVWCGWRLARI